MGQVPDDLKEIDAVAAEVDTLRERTQHIVAELERRVRARAAQAKGAIERVKRTADVRRQLREHPAVGWSVVGVAVVALGFGVYVVVARRLEARRPMARLRARAAGYRAMLADPWRALRPREPIGKRLIAAVLIAGATTLARGLAMVLVKRVIAPRALPPAERRELPELPGLPAR